MHILERYIDCLKKGDPDGFAELFADDAIFHDEAPAKKGRDVLHLEGKTAIHQIFRMYLATGLMKVGNVEVKDNTMKYDIIYNGAVSPVLGTILEEKDGKIKKYHVTSREG